MKILDSYDLLITPLSPVHIGTGVSYEPTNYVIEDDALHEFDPGYAVEALSKADRDVLMRIVERKPDEEIIRSRQAFFYERRSGLIVSSTMPIRVLSGVAEFYRASLRTCEESGIVLPILVGHRPSADVPSSFSTQTTTRNRVCRILSKVGNKSAEPRLLLFGEDIVSLRVSSQIH